MAFTRQQLVSVWVVVLGVFAFSASDRSLGKSVLWLTLGGLAPVIVLALAARFWTSAATTAPSDARGVAAADALDLLRMDSDKG